jgi:hypothetical protein
MADCNISSFQPVRFEPVWRIMTFERDHNCHTGRNLRVIFDQISQQSQPIAQMLRIAFDPSSNTSKRLFGPWLTNHPSWTFLCGESPFRYIINNTTISSTNIGHIKLPRSAKTDTVACLSKFGVSPTITLFHALFSNLAKTSTSNRCTAEIRAF